MQSVTTMRAIVLTDESGGMKSIYDGENWAVV